MSRLIQSLHVPLEFDVCSRMPTCRKNALPAPLRYGMDTENVTRHRSVLILLRRRCTNYMVYVCSICHKLIYTYSMYIYNIDRAYVCAERLWENHNICIYIIVCIYIHIHMYIHTITHYYTIDIIIFNTQFRDTHNEPTYLSHLYQSHIFLIPCVDRHFCYFVFYHYHHCHH